MISVSMQVHYLEIVTPDVDAVCATYAQLYGVSFSEPEAGLGNARTASLPDGGKIGVRAPMHEKEEPVVRPYLLVDDVEAGRQGGVRKRRRDRAPANETPGPRHLRDLHPRRHPPWCLAALIVAPHPMNRSLLGGFSMVILEGSLTTQPQSEGVMRLSAPKKGTFALAFVKHSTIWCMCKKVWTSARHTSQA